MSKETGYCVKCREKREFVEAELVKTKNNRTAIKGKCIECNTGMYKLVKKDYVLEEGLADNNFEESEYARLNEKEI